VVIQTRQHLAAVLPVGPVLVLNLLRWSSDLRDHDKLGIPKDGVKAAGIGAAELRMAEQLVDSMSGPFLPAKYTDRFKTQVLGLVAKKARAGKVHEVVEPQEEAPAGGADIIDLTELLKRSLKGGKDGKASSSGRKRAA
jgi:DNA end-binding protein Ku